MALVDLTIDLLVLFAIENMAMTQKKIIIQNHI